MLIVIYEEGNWTKLMTTDMNIDTLSGTCIVFVFNRNVHVHFLLYINIAPLL